MTPTRRRCARPAPTARSAHDQAHLSRPGNGDYFALLAYIARDRTRLDQLAKDAAGVRDQRHVATCAEFGPALPASTGQAYKGGRQRRVPANHSRDAKDLPVPARRRLRIVKAAQSARRFRCAGPNAAGARYASISRAI